MDRFLTRTGHQSCKNHCHWRHRLASMHQGVMNMRVRPSLVLPLSVLLLAPVASADVFWNEAVDGDLSNDRLAPNAFTFSAGTHSLLANTGGGNLDYLSITVPAGAQFTELRLVSYQGV